MTIKTCLRFRETQEVRLLTSTGTFIAASQYISSHFIPSCKLLHLTQVNYYIFSIYDSLKIKFAKTVSSLVIESQIPLPGAKI